MLMQTKSIADRELLWLTGFYLPGEVTAQGVKQGLDIARLAAFCGVSERTAYRWQSAGLPARVRHLLESVLAGDFLPPAWRKRGATITPDGVQLKSGHFVPLDTVVYWPFIARAVDWSKVPFSRPFGSAS